MPAFDQIGFYLLAAVMAGLVIGALLYRNLSSRHAHYNEVRWRRRFGEMQTEHELSIATLTKTLRHAQEKQAILRQALDESDETIRLLSAERSATFEQDIADRNARIAELKKTLSHARAMLADSQDHETTLQRQVDELQNELASRNQRVDEPQTRTAHSAELETGDQPQDSPDSREEPDATELQLHDGERQLAATDRRPEAYETETAAHRQEVEEHQAQIALLETQLQDMQQIVQDLNDTLCEHKASIADLEADLARERRNNVALERTIEYVYSADSGAGETATERANIISIHDHALTDDLVGGTRADNAEQRIRALESELGEWKRKYEAANVSSGRGTYDRDSAKSGFERRKKKDDLKRIRGIGPALETAMNQLGFFRYRQIAEMEQHDIEQIGRHDHSLPGRIRRYKWIEQARKLQENRHPPRQHPDI